MKKNEISRFLIEPQYAYGKMGCPPRIPADSTGEIFGILLISVLWNVQRHYTQFFQ